MANQIKHFSLSLMILALTLSCNDSGSSSSNPSIDAQPADSSFREDAVTREISETEKEEVLFLWEEEKLARDIYNQMFKKYGKNIFKNIAGSEQQHLTSVKKILDKYNLSTPVSSSDVGTFKNPEIIGLYQDLMARGNNSLYDAYRVGLDIELMDIEDLTRRIDSATDPSLKVIYQNLLEASYNHKAAFEKNL